MSDEQRKLTRRRFLQYTSATTAATGTWYSVAMKTDALAKQKEEAAPRLLSGGPSPYPYHDGSG